ncbi:XylR N-terminal domain-containing protein [Salipaludibacillus sp. CUR1]|uniref:XylR N-terminal domain-containing protein n=1 Tax=Salipaludibacillus sp. CUR1 TaxID=2820003 RepID=UPI001E45865D|nr:XylR N-terminal domain-containing protein [Salipaludibacillus sp. CUR1]MCE7792959.1 XylR N-terminal domain-containing protein [Salipaludibacillus sp. CUR1]
MKAHHLQFEKLIDINPRTGTIFFNRERIALVSVKALGILRKDLIRTLGMERAKGFLMRYGWAWGQNDGESIKAKYNWDNVRELMLAGPALHTLEGVVSVEPDHLEITGDSLHFTGYWRNSFEAVEHIHHFGLEKESICWTLTGYASGYLTSTFGKEVIVYEDKCSGKGDPYCKFTGKTKDLDENKFNELMRYYKADSLITELDRAYHEIREVNKNIIESDQIQQKLTNMSLEDKDLSETIRYVASVLDKSIIIDYYNKIVESVFITDEHRLIYRSWTNDFSYTAEQQNGIATFPIRANHVNLGRMVVVSRDKLTSKEQLIIKRALSVMTIQMFHQWKLTHTLWKKKENFFEEMLQNPDSEAFEKRSYLFNFHPESLNRMLSVKVNPDTQCAEILKLLDKAYEEKDVFSKGAYILIILSGEEAEAPNAISEDIHRLLQDNFPALKFYIGVGRKAESLRILAKSYLDACKISDFIHLAHPQSSRISYFDNLEHVMMLLKGTDQEELILFYRKIIGKLVEYDKTNQSKFIMTLKSYLDHNGNLQDTANDLHLSIAGLRYRLERIENICHTDLKSGTGRFQYQLAIQIYYAIKIDHNHKKLLM